MKVKERRIVVQDWYGTETTKTGWDSNGWFFKDDGHCLDESEWIIKKHLDSDKYSNPILAIAEKKTKVF